jgi:hypothetical protein
VKYLLILALFAFVAVVFYIRLRPYIRGVRRFLGVVREVNRMNAAARTDAGSSFPREEKPARAPGEKLVRCAACGTWTADSRAVRMRLTGATYCSHACLERAADSPRRAHKSA